MQIPLPRLVPKKNPKKYLGRTALMLPTMILTQLFSTNDNVFQESQEKYLKLPVVIEVCLFSKPNSFSWKMFEETKTTWIVLISYGNSFWKTKIFKRLNGYVEVLNRHTQFVSLFKNHQIEHSGLTDYSTWEELHFTTLERKSYSSVVLSLRPKIHWQPLERKIYIIQTLPGFIFFTSNVQRI